MWVESDSGPVLGLHLGMAGRIVVDGEPAKNNWDRFTIEFTDGGRLALRDKRRLGRAVLEPDLSTLGPDAAEVSRARFRDRVGRGTALRPAGDLSQEELDELRRQLRAATRRAIRRGGVHTGDLIPARHRGGSCPRCGAALERQAVGGRTSYWCPREQDWPRAA